MNQQKVVFAGKLAPPPISNWEKSARNYRAEMYSVYCTVCKKNKLIPMTRNDFIDGGLSGTTTRKRETSAFRRWITW